jgi:ABC-2 type transport system ATP-binding protein
MDEAQYLADRVAVIAHGEIVAEGSPKTLAGRNLRLTTIRFTLPPDAGEPSIDGIVREDGVWELRAEDPTRQLHALTSWALERAVHLEDLEVSRPSLEDVYLEITGGEEVSA